MTTDTGSTAVRQAKIRRVRPEDAGRMRALRLEMLADAPLAFLETLADAAARPHNEHAARVAYTSVGPTPRSSSPIPEAGWSGTPVARYPARGRADSDLRGLCHADLAGQRPAR